METQAMVIGGVEYRVRLEDSVPKGIVAFLPDAHLKNFINDMETMQMEISSMGKIPACVFGHPQDKVFFVKYCGDGASLYLCHECGQHLLVLERMNL